MEIILAIILCLLILLLLFKGRLFDIFQVHMDSMNPVLLSGDRVLCKFYSRHKFILSQSQPKLSEIVALRNPENQKTILVKRLVARGSQTVEINNKGIFVDQQRFLEFLEIDREIVQQCYVIPDNHIFVLGDNYSNSRDSRHWGAIPENLLIGKIIFVLFSITPDLTNRDSFVKNLLSIWRRIKWERFIKSIE